MLVSSLLRKEGPLRLSKPDAGQAMIGWNWLPHGPVSWAVLPPL